ncbi:hypothetical protein [Sinomonas mesophila]|uniref:hypothetical protein n=1 Tax=Sinomonas mesophila TaxID=1531955 RepID=UPI000984502D|nr:hypothetical protein [Sinomonas mesophila]
MGMALFADVSGWLGAAATLAGYAAFSLGWITSGRLFQGINLLGSMALIINGSYHGAWPFVALNSAWGTISIVAMVRLTRMRRHAARTSHAERPAPGAPAQPAGSPSPATNRLT